MVDAVGTIIGVFEAVNQIPIRYEQVPAGRDRRRARRSRTRASSSTRGSTPRACCAPCWPTSRPARCARAARPSPSSWSKLNYLPATPSANDKIVEATYAVELEKKLTKQQILERYLNTVYFGNGSYGIQAAGRDVLQQERRPAHDGRGRLPGRAHPERRSGYDPFRYPDRSKARREQALEPPGRDRQDDRGRRPPAANATPIPAAPQRQRNDGKASSYFADQVKEILLNKTTDPGRGPADALQRLLPRRPEDLHHARTRRCRWRPSRPRLTQMPDTGGRFDSAIVSLDTKSGAVRAMVGRPRLQPARGEPHHRTPPDRFGREVHDPRGRPRGRRAGQRPHRRHGPVHPAQPARSEGPLRHHRRRQRRRRHHRQPHRPLDQLHVRQARPRARPRPHDRRDAADGRQVEAPRGAGARHGRQRDLAARHGVGVQLHHQPRHPPRALLHRPHRGARRQGGLRARRRRPAGARSQRRARRPPTS